MSWVISWCDLWDTKKSRDLLITCCCVLYEKCVAFVKLLTLTYVCIRWSVRHFILPALWSLWIKMMWDIENSLKLMVLLYLYPNPHLHILLILSTLPIPYNLFVCALVSVAGLKRICKAIVEAEDDQERTKAFAPLQEMITFVQFANDECDYGMGLELGMDLFCYGSRVRNTCTVHPHRAHTHNTLRHL